MSFLLYTIYFFTKNNITLSPNPNLEEIKRTRIIQNVNMSFGSGHFNVQEIEYQGMEYPLSRNQYQNAKKNIIITNTPKR